MTFVFRYPVVYLFYMTPIFTVRWLSFSGFTVHYRVSLFASTLFSLSGMLNTALFFLTRPDLVIGPTPAIDIQMESLKSPSSENLGSLPTRSPPATCNCTPPVGANTNTRAPPLQVGPNAASHWHTTYTSGERRYGNFRSTPALAPVEETEYGNLPV